jgi:hypothetical protein
LPPCRSHIAALRTRLMGQAGRSCEESACFGKRFTCLLLMGSH